MTTANIIVSISGRPKTGKTYLSMSFPAPIKVFSFDLGANFIRTKFPDKEIDIEEITLPVIENTDQAWAEPYWDAFEEQFKEDIESGKYQTIVLDTATVVWQMCHQAITEKRHRKQLLEVEYFQPNLKMSALFARAKIAGINLVVIQYTRERYVKGENTGESELDGWKRTEGNSDVNIEMSTVGTGASLKMRATIKDNRFERTLNGTSYDDMTYDDLMTLLGV